MNTFRIISDKSRYVVAALLVAFSVFVPVMASAAQLTTRSVELSSSTKGATANYTVNFTAAADAGAVVVDFCSNSPLLGQECDAPGGLSLSAATVGGGFTKDAGESTANKLVATGTIDVSTEDEISIPITGVVNPADAGTIYARIVTYVDGTAAGAYDSSTVYHATNNPNNPGTHIDDGSVAISITDGIAVSGDVLESLSFCVSGVAIDDGCETSTAPGSAPTLKLGEDMGNGVVALSTEDVSSKPVYTQITTNAVGGAIVSLKSSASDCGGLVRAGAEDNEAGCGIKPALLADAFNDATTGKALFGVKTATATNGTGGEGAYVPVGNYGNTNYLMNFTEGANPSSGVTSPYGDQFLTTSGAPAINKNMTLTFGAQAANNTPAGSYSANLSLIATGKF